MTRVPGESRRFLIAQLRLAPRASMRRPHAALADDTGRRKPLSHPRRLPEMPSLVRSRERELLPEAQLEPLAHRIDDFHAPQIYTVRLVQGSEQLILQEKKSSHDLEGRHYGHRPIGFRNLELDRWWRIHETNEPVFKYAVSKGAHGEQTAGTSFDDCTANAAKRVITSHHQMIQAIGNRPRSDIVTPRQLCLCKTLEQHRGRPLDQCKLTVITLQLEHQPVAA